MPRDEENRRGPKEKENKMSTKFRTGNKDIATRSPKDCLGVRRPRPEARGRSRCRVDGTKLDEGSKPKVVVKVNLLPKTTLFLFTAFKDPVVKREFIIYVLNFYDFNEKKNFFKRYGLM